MVINAEQVSVLAGVSKQTVINDIDAGKLKATREGHAWRVEQSDALEYARRWEERRKMEARKKKARAAAAARAMRGMRKGGGK